MDSVSDIEQKIKEHGTKLLEPPAAVNELLEILNIIEQLLIVIDQAPSRSMQAALIPCMMGLIASDILRHPDMDVKVSAAFCINEITRITAPDPPYNDEKMKEVFQLTLAAFGNLPHASSRSYKKLVSIIDTVSRVKSFLMLLDLELNDLIIQMFKQFLEIIRSSHSRTVFSAMETIMTEIINDSDDIPLGLLTPLLESVKKEKQDVSPLSCKLGEKVITSCATKLKPYLTEAVKSMGTALDDYVQIVAKTCEYRLDIPKQNGVNVSQEHSVQPEPDNLCSKDSAQSPHGASKSGVSPDGTLVDCNNTETDEVTLKEPEHATEQSKASEEHCNVEETNLKPNEEMNLEIVLHSAPKKRGRKPKSLKKPEEGHEHSSIVSEKNDVKKLQKRRSCDSEINNMVLGLAAVPLKKNRVSNDMELTPGDSQKEGTSVLPNQPITSGCRRKRGRPKKSESRMQQDVDPNSVSSSRKCTVNNIADVKEEVRDAADVGSEKDIKDSSDLKEKPWGQIKKIGNSSTTGEVEALAEGDIASEKEADGPSGTKRKSTGAINSSGDHTEISLSQKLKVTKTSKSTPKKKHSSNESIAKKKAYEMGDLDERLIGKRVKVWWPMDKTYYEGVIDSFNRTKKRHKVLYTDGEIENLNLYKKRWKLIPDGPSPDAERTDNQVASSSPNRFEVSARVTEVEASNPCEQSLVESRIDHSSIDTSAVETSKGCDKTVDDGAHFGVVEKLADGGAESREGEKIKDHGHSGRPEKLKSDGVEFVGGERLKDDNLISDGGENLDDDHGIKYGGGENLKDKYANSKISEKLKDDNIETAQGKNLSDDNAKSEGGEKLDDDGANSGGVKYGGGDNPKDDGVKSTARTNTASEVGIARDVTERRRS